VVKQTDGTKFSDEWLKCGENLFASSRNLYYGISRREQEVTVILIAIFLSVICLLSVIWIRRTTGRREMEQYSITAEALYELLATSPPVLLFDVRQPLDLLAHTEIIPGAKRIPPKEVLADPSLIPKDKDAVVYCTCPSDETSRAVLHRAQALKFLRIKFLRGGLEAWKAKGYPVEPYTESFHL
jgi:rhodanese-related sulfurtransferase